MLKYIKGHLTSIDGIEIYPIISLVIFLAFFVGVIWYLVKTDKKTINELKQMPLDED
ncbi:MAG: CcoQ/FixQ family Cbb3-type cytochrome c oxidase assembly chaperone [Putridiphycobacter sp.]|jgi:cytochrome c oxidase cbb3-type subunit 4|nr:CcoQ/FixQ family Cbb3-type cytochrome c oxidase assembly chaperone [Putridiphycobacter sp.]